MSRSSVKLIGSFIVILAMLILGVHQAQAKGHVYRVRFNDDTTKEGRIDVHVYMERSDGSGEQDQILNFFVEADDWTKEDKANSLEYEVQQDNPHLMGGKINGNTVEFETDDDCPHYDDINSVMVEEDTDESVSVWDDPVSEWPIARLQLNVDAISPATTGSAGTFTFGLRDTTVEVSTDTAGKTGDAIESDLVAAFNALGSDYTASIEGGQLVVPDVPCPIGVTAGTTDTVLKYAVEVRRTGFTSAPIPTLGQWGVIVTVALLLVVGIVVLRFRGLSAG